jgi:excisionase family DNA binding protein
METLTETKQAGKHGCNCTTCNCSKVLPESDFYTPGELAGLLNVPLRTVEKWTLQRRLPVCKVGRLNKFPRVEIQKRLLNGSLLK